MPSPTRPDGRAISSTTPLLSQGSAVAARRRGQDFSSVMRSMVLAGRAVAMPGTAGQVQRSGDVGPGGPLGALRATGPEDDPASDRLTEEFRRRHPDPNVEGERQESLSLWGDPRSEEHTSELQSL